MVVAASEGEEEVAAVAVSSDGISDEAMIYRALGFLAVAAVLLGVYLRFVKPAAADKAQ